MPPRARALPRCARVEMAPIFRQDVKGGGGATRMVGGCGWRRTPRGAGGSTSRRRCKILGHADGKIPGLLYGLSSRAAIARTCRCRRRRRRCRRARFASCAADADCCTGELVAVRAGGSGVSLYHSLSGPAVVLSSASLLLLYYCRYLLLILYCTRVWVCVCVCIARKTV